MKLWLGNRYIVSVDQRPMLGTPWIVRTYRSRFFLRKQISADWFLDKGQAERFAIALREEYEKDSSLAILKSRPPGWVLRPPTRQTNNSRTSSPHRARTNAADADPWLGIPTSRNSP